MKHAVDSHKILDLHKTTDLTKVVLETRFVSEDIREMIRFRKFTLACMRDCFSRGEAPYASHMLYAETYVLNEFSAEERALGMHAGFLWGSLAEKTVVYSDLGIGSGMQKGIDTALAAGRPVEVRSLGIIPEVSDEEVEMELELRLLKTTLLKEILGYSEHLADLSLTKVGQ